MIRRKSNFFLGIFIFLIPFLGLPSSWKTALIVLSAIVLVVLSIEIPLPQKAVKKTIKHPSPRRRKIVVETQIPLEQGMNASSSDINI